MPTPYETELEKTKWIDRLSKMSQQDRIDVAFTNGVDLDGLQQIIKEYDAMTKAYDGTEIPVLNTKEVTILSILAQQDINQRQENGESVDADQYMRDFIEGQQGFNDRSPQRSQRYKERLSQQGPVTSSTSADKDIHQIRGESMKSNHGTEELIADVLKEPKMQGILANAVDAVCPDLKSAIKGGISADEMNAISAKFTADVEKASSSLPGDTKLKLLELKEQGNANPAEVEEAINMAALNYLPVVTNAVEECVQSMTESNPYHHLPTEPRSAPLHPDKYEDLPAAGTPLHPPSLPSIPRDKSVER